MAEKAHFFQAEGCCALILEALASLDAPSLSLDDVNGMLAGGALPSNVLNLDAYTNVQDKCLKWLVQKYGDLWLTITHREWRESFCKLSLAAVLLWASSDHLTVMSENDVVVLMALWCRANQHTCETHSKELLQLGDRVSGVLVVSTPYPHACIRTTIDYMHLLCLQFTHNLTLCISCTNEFSQTLRTTQLEPLNRMLDGRHT